MLAVLLCGYLLLFLVADLPFVQDRLSSGISKAASETLGTEVRIENVHLGLFNSLILEGVKVNDQNGGNLLSAERLSAKVRIRSLFFSPITIRTVELYRASINLEKRSEASPYNFGFVIDSLSKSKETESKPLNLKVKSVILSQCSVSYDKQYEPAKNTFDLNHLKLDELDASIGFTIINGDSVKARVRNIAFKERCGFRMKRGFILATLGKNSLDAPILQLETPYSKIDAEKIRLVADKDKKVSGSAVLKRSALSTRDARYFLDMLLPNHTYYMSADVKVDKNRVSVPNLQVNADHGYFNAYANVDYLSPDDFKVKLNNLSARTELLQELAEAFGLGEDNVRLIENLGDVSVKGTASRKYGNLVADAGIGCAAGNVELEANMSGDSRLEASAASHNLRLGQILGSDDLGNADFSARVNADGKEKLSALLNLKSIEFKGYSYNNVSAEVRKTRGNYDFSFGSQDKNAQFKGSGALDASDAANPRYRLDASLQNVNLNALNLLEKYGDTSFAAHVTANGAGHDINTFNGTIALQDFKATKADSTINLGNVELSARDVSNGRQIALTGDFGDAEMRGKFNIATLPENFLQVINAKKERGHHCSDDNIFDFNLRLKDAALINLFANADLRIQPGNYVSGYFDSHEGKYQLEASVPSMGYGKGYYSDISLYLKGNTDDTRMRFHASKYLEQGKLEIESTIASKGSDLENTILWKSSAGHRNSGEISQTLSFPDSKSQRIESSIHPSTIVIDDTVWNVSSSRLVYDGGKLYVSGLRLDQGKNQLALDGVVSKSSEDSLQVGLRNIRIQNVLDFVNFDDVQFDGHATGKVSVASVLDAPQVTAAISADDFIFNHAAMGHLNLDSYWNNSSKKIEIYAIIRDGEHTTNINGYVNPAESDIDLHFLANGTNAKFLNDFFPEAMQLSSGRTTGTLRLFGNLHAMNLEGMQVVSEMKVGVDPLGTQYTLESDTVYFTPDLISFPAFTLHDVYGNVSSMSGSVRHRALHDFSYEMFMQPRNFLAYDKNEDDDEGSTFWGTAYVDGTIHLYGGSGFFTTDANVTPREKTVFVYNADQPESADNVQMLRFRNADSQEAEDTLKVKADKEVKENNVGTDIRLNFNLNVTPDAELRVIMDDKTGNTISAHGQGNILAQFYNKGAFEMFGIYNIENGIYHMKFQDLLQKNFALKSGSRIAFNGNPLACALNMKAVYTIPAVSLAGVSMQGSLRDSSVPVDCIMNITGSALQPSVNFDIDMPSVSADQKQMVRSLIATSEDMNLQAMYLLSVGRFYTYNYDMAATEQTQSQTATAMNSFLSSTLSSNINNLLQSFGQNNGNWTFGTNLATGNDGWNDMDVEGMFTGRLFKGRLLIDGNLGYRDRSAYNSNFVGDFTARYLLNPRGTIQLKAYNESNDRYFTKSTLTTQGGGIVFKKDFTKVMDIFKKKKSDKDKKASGK